MLEFIAIVIESLCLIGDIPKHLSPEDRRLFRNIILVGTLIFVVLGVWKLSTSA